MADELKIRFLINVQHLSKNCVTILEETTKTYPDLNELDLMPVNNLRGAIYSNVPMNRYSADPVSIHTTDRMSTNMILLSECVDLCYYAGNVLSPTHPQLSYLLRLLENVNVEHARRIIFYTTSE